MADLADLAALDDDARPLPCRRGGCGADRARRGLLRGGLSGLGLVCVAPAGWLTGCGAARRLVAAAGRDDGGSMPAFRAVTPSGGDRVDVPAGYTATAVAAWGDAVGVAGAMPAWAADASATAAEQALQVGQHGAGVQHLALAATHRGLLVVAHAGSDDGLLHAGGMAGWSAEKVRKSQAAQGVSVFEIEAARAGWQMLRPSKHARRITAATPVLLAGPAAGHALLKTAADPDGRRVLGSCGNGPVASTPWGTCLVGEPHFAAAFVSADQPTADERRYGLSDRSPWRWHEFDNRFDAVRHPNEPNRYGWLLEIDPGDAASPPVKRTALGRAAHAGVCVSVAADGRAVVHAVDGGAAGCIYKFVSRERIRPAAKGLSAAEANAGLLDDGVLYAARFEADGSGRWLPLAQGTAPLLAAAGFADAGAVLVRTRQAADALAATAMPRPAALAIDAAGRWACAALADTRRIVRWRDIGGAEAGRFEWNTVALADAAGRQASAAQAVLQARPSCLAFDHRGLLWVGTGPDAATAARAEAAEAGAGRLFAVNPAGGEPRCFLVGPPLCEVAGVAWTPDGRTMFVDIQHPGQASGNSDPRAPRRGSNWPDFQSDGRPRSATIAIRRNDGGVV